MSGSGRRPLCADSGPPQPCPCDLGAFVAIFSVLAGGWAMLISDTRMERFEVVTATVGGAVALAVCLAYGSGLSG